MAWRRLKLADLAFDRHVCYVTLQVVEQLYAVHGL